MVKYDFKDEKLNELCLKAMNIKSLSHELKSKERGFKKSVDGLLEKLENEGIPELDKKDLIGYLSLVEFKEDFYNKISELDSFIDKIEAYSEGYCVLSQKLKNGGKDNPDFFRFFIGRLDKPVISPGVWQKNDLSIEGRLRLNFKGNYIHFIDYTYSGGASGIGFHLINHFDNDLLLDPKEVILFEENKDKLSGLYNKDILEYEIKSDKAYKKNMLYLGVRATQEFIKDHFDLFEIRSISELYNRIEPIVEKRQKMLKEAREF
jgi:hypothetical protein